MTGSRRLPDDICDAGKTDSGAYNPQEIAVETLIFQTTATPFAHHITCFPDDSGRLRGIQRHSDEGKRR